MAITIDTPWLEIPRITPAIFAGALRRLASPIYPTSDAAYILSIPDPTLALGIAVRETRAGTAFDDPVYQAGQNALALRDPITRAPMVFPDWACAFAEFKRRITDPSYKDGVYQNAHSIRDFCAVYTGLADKAARDYAGNLVLDIKYWLSLLV